jgi:hypothetical protein
MGFLGAFLLSEVEKWLYRVPPGTYKGKSQHPKKKDTTNGTLLGKNLVTNQPVMSQTPVGQKCCLKRFVNLIQNVVECFLSEFKKSASLHI